MYRPNLSSSKKPKPRVFISYAREDIGYASRLFEDLSRLGANPWLDKRTLLPGQDWADAIEDAIREADFFVALLSSHSVAKRGYVQKEVKKALDVLDELPPKRIYLIPARLSNCRPQHRRLKDLNWVDLFPDWHNGIRQIGFAMDLRKGFDEGSTSKSYRRRKTLVLPSSAVERLERMRIATDATSDTEVIRRALRLYEIIIEQESRGGKLLLREDGIDLPLSA